MDFKDYILFLSLTITTYALNSQIDVYIPSSCDFQDDVYINTVTNTTEFITTSTFYKDIDVTISTFDSCDEATVLDTLATRLSNQALANHVTIGPGLHALCEPISRLAHFYNKTLISAFCTNRNLDRFDHYGYFMRTAVSNQRLGIAFAALLRKFLWKRVAIVTSTNAQCWTVARDVYYYVTREGFLVSQVIEIEADYSDTWLLSQLQAISDNTKAIFFCLDDSQIDDVMTITAQSNLDNGDRALFLTLTSRSFQSVNMEGITVPPWNPGRNVTLTQRLYRSVFLLNAHPYPYSVYEEYGFESSFSTIQSSEVDANLFHAMSITASTLQQLSINYSSDTSINSQIFYNQARNIDFLGLYGNLTLNNEAQLEHYISIWDYKRDTNTYQLVMQISPATTQWEELGVIDWVTGRPPDDDYCEFYNCDDPAEDEVSVGMILGIISSIIVLAVVAMVTAWLVRRKLIQKEMEKGPNKIILQEMDLVFVTPKTNASKSMKSLKPDLIQSHHSSFLEEPSEFSQSHSSFPDYMEAGDIARYNGDVVFLKQILIKGFEMKSKVRQYLKTIRELRHENINPFIGCYTDPFRASLVFEYCSRKSLEDLIANETIKLDWDFKLSLLTDLVKGMKYLHNSHMRFHGRLKSGNCVIDSRFVLKITDYGVNALYEKYQTRRNYTAKELLWTAPELLRNEDLLYTGSQKGDVFSFAIIMQEVILRGHPYCMMDLDATEIIKKVRKPPPLCRPSVSQQAAPPQYIQIMKQCWAEMPDMRPDFDDINKQFKDIAKGKKHNIVDSMFKKLEKYSSDLEAIVAERTGQFEEEKKKVENLLSQMLPITVARALMNGEHVDPESFDSVTIYFSDIVGFTTISAMSTPIQVVELLNDLYTMFDTTIDEYDVYKVETIGDAYMVCSGLPIRNGNRHAGEVGTMALDLLSQCGQFTIRHMQEVPLRLRIGLHTGSCVAGVVGLRMPRYCLFGDTVNTSSRMESTGAAFRVHISPVTKGILDELGGYHLDYRGETELKGKGIFKTYWLIGKDGFTKPLPEPPPLTGGDNHGLGSVIDKNKENKADAQSKTNPSSDNQSKPAPLNKTNSNNNNSIKAAGPIKDAVTKQSDKKAPIKTVIANGHAGDNNKVVSAVRNSRESRDSLQTNSSDKSDLSTSPIRIEEKA